MWEHAEFGWMLTPDLGVHGGELQRPIGFLHDFFPAKRKAASVKQSKAPRRRPASTSDNRRSRK